MSGIPARKRSRWRATISATFRVKRVYRSDEPCSVETPPPSVSTKNCSRTPDAALPQRVDGRGVRGFVGGDLRGLFQDVAEFVDALDEAVFGEGIHRKFDHAAAGRGQRLVGQIDLHDGAGNGGE